MKSRGLSSEGQQALEKVLGYCNLSSGSPDPQMLASANTVYRLIESQRRPEPTWRIVGRLLADRLEELTQCGSPAFRDARQATAGIELLFQHLIPGYLEFHRELLFHQDEQQLIRPFFLGRALEVLLQQGPPWDQRQRITDRAIAQLNDYIGHRPVAALVSQKIEPYPHEWVRPIPLFVRAAGVACGTYEQVVRSALEMLEGTDRDLLESAYFDPDALEELAVDPRAYDFDHPANKRPNYHFGQWDPHCIDNRGRYTRFVIQQVTLDVLMDRLAEAGEMPEQLLYEAAAVLAGTVLMASAISGSGPGCHDSTTTLAALLPRIAAFRDTFYERLLRKAKGSHRKRLEREAAEKRQPFGGARQDLNARLARLRASQLEHAQLARVFARMGYFDAAQKQADVVPVASARILCRIDCQLTAGQQALAAGDLQRAASIPARIEALLRDGIQCGAIIDPWNIIGFDAHFSLFPALENSVHDHRADELVTVMEQLFALYTRLWSEASAIDNQELCRNVDQQFHETATWWRQYAAHEVSAVQCDDPLEDYHAAKRVAQALNLWHKGGAAAGDIGFWAGHAEMFDAPRAYALVCESLLERDDVVASMSLLIHWLSQADRMPLEQGESSFHQLAERWLLAVGTRPKTESDPDQALPDPWRFVRKFFDFLEANAEEYWRVPRFELGKPRRADPSIDQLFQPSDEDSSDSELFSAAYEDMVYRDTSDDGVDGETLETGTPSDDALSEEASRLSERLAFLASLARIWRLVVANPEFTQRSDAEPEAVDGRRNTMRRWVEQAMRNRCELMQLLADAQNYQLPLPACDQDAMIEYDRQRIVKESLLERIIATSVETADAARMLMAAIAADCDDGAAGPQEISAADDQSAIHVFSAAIRRDRDAIRQRLPALISAIKDQPLLYVPLSKGGEPNQIVAARTGQRSLQDLLAWLPRLGLLGETCQLIDVAREMERDNPVGPGAVTEFDELFKIGYRSIVENLVFSSKCWNESTARSADVQLPESTLVACLERLTESLLLSWLAHSRTLRLSVLEKVEDKKSWSRLVDFIERYGDELFTQRFLVLGNLRAILHQGVDCWLEQLQKDGSIQLRLLDELDEKIPRREAVEQLSLVLEAIVENYAEYRDYNSTTTQSDRGELLYTLLDFLRLRTRYDRICWNLKPVILAHEILVRRKRNNAAKLWRRALMDRINEEADLYLERLDKLQKKYAMRMPTVADRLAERFVRPMAIDRMRALVEPAIREATQAGPHPTFELLEHETELLTRQPTGVGLDIPPWLVALEEEVERVRSPGRERDDPSQLLDLIPPLPLPLAEVQDQLDQLSDEE